MLVAATSTAGEIVALCGMTLNPYKEGKLGVVEEGAYADLLLVDGNPLEDITVIGGVDKWFDAPPSEEQLAKFKQMRADWVIASLTGRCCSVKQAHTHLSK